MCEYALNVYNNKFDVKYAVGHVVRISFLYQEVSVRWWWWWWWWWCNFGTGYSIVGSIYLSNKRRYGRDDAMNSGVLLYKSCTQLVMMWDDASTQKEVYK